MRRHPAILATLLALAPWLLAGCDGGQPDAAGDAQGDAPAVVDGGAADGAAPAGGGEGEAPAPESGDAGAEASGELGVGVIASGTAEAPLAEPTPAPPEAAGRSRRVAEAELPGLVRFTLFQPTFLPEESYTVAPIITEPEADGPTEGLPSVATGYTVADQHSFAFVQSPAGEGPMPVGDGTAEEITIGGLPATLYENSQGKLEIIWENGDTRLQVRSAGLARDVVLQIAEGLQPAP